MTCYALLRLWNELPKELGQPVDNQSLSLSSRYQFIISFITTFTIHQSFSLPLHAQKTNLFLNPAYHSLPNLITYHTNTVDYIL